MRPDLGLPGPARDERGVALPLALLALVSISLLVTTALITSSTELAISGAHRDATRAFYVADGGLQAYVAARGPALMADTAGSLFFLPPGGAGDEEVEVSVRFLGQQTLADRSILRVFSVLAWPARGGGRRVSTLVRQVIPAPRPPGTDITAALTLGGDLGINGNAFTVSGRVASAACGATSVDAVRIAAGSEVRTNNTNHMRNLEGAGGVGWDAIDQTSLTRDQLALEVLGGKSLSELIALVPPSHRWGPRYAEDRTVRRWDGVLDTVPAVPEDEKVAVVDAEGGTVEVKGGRGLLVVVNGSVEMNGRARFDGIIIAEGSFLLRGTPRVNGALVSLARDADSRIDLGGEAELAGHVTVQYDRCAVEGAEAGFADLSQQMLAPEVRGTSAWMEAG